MSLRNLRKTCEGLPFASYLTTSTMSSKDGRVVNTANKVAKRRRLVAVALKEVAEIVDQKQKGPNKLYGIPQQVLRKLTSMLSGGAAWTKRFIPQIGKQGLSWLVCKAFGEIFSPSNPSRTDKEHKCNPNKLAGSSSSKAPANSNWRGSRDSLGGSMTQFEIGRAHV